MNRTIPESESITVEFKSDRNRLPDRDLVASVVCLANTEGGEIYLGVEKDGAITGLHPEHHNLREQMVLQYVRTQGRIARSEAAELCRLSLDQAKRLLLRMVEEGQLAQQGVGKATYYELASNIRARPHSLRARPYILSDVDGTHA